MRMGMNKDGSSDREEPYRRNQACFSGPKRATAAEHGDSAAAGGDGLQLGERAVLPRVRRRRLRRHKLRRRRHQLTVKSKGTGNQYVNVALEIRLYQGSLEPFF